MNDTLADLAQALDHEPYCLIVTEQRCYTSNKRARAGASGDVSSSDETNTSPKQPGRDKPNVIKLVSGIVTRIDLLEFISRDDQEASE